MSPSINKCKTSSSLLRFKIQKLLLSNPLRSLLCAILLCLPLVIVFTTTTSTKNVTNRFIHNLPNNNTLQLTEYKEDEIEKELLRVASNTNPNPSSTNPKKLAFMFLTTSTLPFAPLWESFFKQAPKTHFTIYVHVDETSSIWKPHPFSVFHNRIIPSKPTARNSPTLAAAARRLLACALVDDPDNYMFLLLSASCIPLHSFRFTYHTLANSNKSFIEMTPQDLGSFYRWVVRGAHVMLPEVRYEEFRTGSQFWSLTRKHAMLIVSDTRVWSKFKLPCLFYFLEICYPEESYFPTLMNMLDTKGCVHATLTYVDWTGSDGGHPRMFEKDEIGPQLISALRTARPKYGDDDDGKRHDPFLFARKFSSDSLQALMAIADHVIFKD
ncbi:glycosyltransferase BC10-like [Arachis stenosperma]|uniref:glycosyltransferase BC10-like n=1 Tax=Arachis stenosperma TaxID=217475 RepID=UPI0025AC6FB4|nr:glycosyltransferase BC10-like [Arachis stenosperma]